MKRSIYWNARGLFSVHSVFSLLIFFFLMLAKATPGFSQPVTQATNVAFSAVQPTSMTISWINGDGNARIVVVKALSPISSTPVDGINYSASTNFTNTGSSTIGGGKVVYRNTGISVNVTNLSPGTTYYVQVFEFTYNGSIGTTNGSQEYLISTATNNPASVTTPAASATAQASYISFSNITSSSITLNWINGNNYSDNKRIVVARTSATVVNPVNGTTYPANPIYGSSGSELGGAYVVYDGSGSSVTVSNLLPSVRYYFQVFEYTVTPSVTYLTTTVLPTNPNSQSTKPSPQASNIVSSSVTTTSAVISWTNGNGSGRILVAREGGPVDALPEDGVSYTDGAGAFLSGSQIGNGNFVVYTGTGTSVTVTNLLDGVYYYFQVFERSGNAIALASYTPNIVVYNTSSATNNPGTPILTPAKFNYQTKTSGPWESNSTWLEFKANPSPGVWVDANSYPVNRDIVQVGTGHSVTLSATAAPDVLNVDGTLTIASSGQLTVSANKRYANNLFMAPGFGVLNINGKLILEDKAVATGNTAINTFFNSGSVYEHQYKTEGVIPLATWHTNSTLLVTGYSNITTNIIGTSAGNWGQSFGHVTFNCPITATGRHIDLNGFLRTINGNLSVISTGVSNNGLILISNNAATTINIGGDLLVSPAVGTSAHLILSFSGTVSPIVNVAGSATVSGGSQSTGTFSMLTLNNSTVSGSPQFNIGGSINIGGEARLMANGTGGTPIVNIANNVNLTSTNSLGSSFNDSGNPIINVNGSFLMNAPGGMLSFGSGASGAAVVNIKNNFTLTAGTITHTGTDTNYGQINFTGGGIPSVQYFSNSGTMSGKINMLVADNTTLDIPSTNGFGGAGDFVLGSNATLRVGSNAPGGAFRMAADASGSLFNSGLRTFGNPSTLIFNGTGTQGIGNDYPGSMHPNVNLIINKASGSVSANAPFSITGNFVLQQGEFIAPGGENKLTLSGNFQRVNGSFTHNGGILSLNGTGLQATQTLDGMGAEFYTIEVNKPGGGMVDVVSYLPLAHLLTISSPTVIQNPSPAITNPTPTFSNQPFLYQGLTLLSRGESTDNDGRIGVIPAGASVTGLVTAQRYMENKGTINRYISMPVQSVGVFQLQDDFTVTGSFTGSSYPCTGCRAGNPASLRYYDELVMGTNEKGYKQWPTSQNGQSLETGKGYLAYMWENTVKILDVAGPIHSGNISFPISYSNTGNPSADGWNLIGNPYPSAIQWGEANGGWDLNNNSIDPVIAVPDLSIKGYPNYYRTWNYVDGSGDPGFGSGDLEGGIIAMGQAFWVKANTPGASLTINENAKIGSSGSGNFYRQKSGGKSQQLTISITNGRNRDNAFFKLNPKATDEFDVFDGYKLMNEEMNIYLLDRAQRNLVMHTLSEVKDQDRIAIGMDVKEPGVYTISFSNVEQFRYGQALYLIDSEEHQAIPVSDGGYTFTLSNSSQPVNDRFYLSLSPESMGSEQVVLLYPNPVKDIVNLKLSRSNREAKATLFDFSGKALVQSAWRGESSLDMSGYSAGMYILRVETSDGVVVKKIVKND